MTTQHEPVRPVRYGQREIGAYVTAPDGVTFVPAVDVTVIVVAALTAATAIAAVVSAGTAVRRRPTIGTVTMGPGGWLSLRNSAAPALRPTSTTRRPWWAHALQAHRV
ncbi:hypothetical protein AB0M02_39730 [Actinoplanes sp. NPDC051861]|uniref:hypothetical protein n=1 Tax=Actinoplanes sp. NPDC051861 TaxID=3155170 RepID=UPI0034372899